MSIRICPKDNYQLNEEVRRELSDHQKAIQASVRAHNKGLDRMHQIIGGCFAPSDVTYLVCPICGWECRAYEYDNEVSLYNAMARLAKKIKKE